MSAALFQNETLVLHDNEIYIHLILSSKNRSGSQFLYIFADICWIAIWDADIKQKRKRDFFSNRHMNTQAKWY